MTLISIVNVAFDFYEFILIVRILLSWIRINPSNRFLYNSMEFIYSITDPLLNKIRSILNLNFGGLDFSPLIAFLLLNIIKNILIRIIVSSM